MNPYRAQVQARAAENRVFVVHANAPANPDLSASHGQSRIVDPDGNIIQEASQFDEEVLIADLRVVGGESRERPSVAGYSTSRPMVAGRHASRSGIEMMARKGILP